MIKSSNQIQNIFDRNFHKIQLKRCKNQFTHHSFIVEEICSDLTQRTAELFLTQPDILCYGLWDDKSLLSGNVQRGFLIEDWLPKSNPKAIIFDEENNIFVKPQFDLIISNLSMHFVNDILGALIQYKRALKPEGKFIATFFGGKTLQELKAAFFACDQYFNTPSFPRIIPFIDIRDAASLMQRAGFKKIVTDSYEIACQYSNIKKLFYDIKGFGQSNPLIVRDKKPLSRKYLNTLEELYKQLTNLHATFEIITITGQN